MPIGFKTISVKTEDADYLDQLKLHPNAGIWEPLHKLIEEHKAKQIDKEERL